MVGRKAREELAGKPLEQFLRELLAREAPLSPEERVAASQLLRAGQPPIDFDVRAAIRWGRDDEFFEIEQAVPASSRP